MIHFIGVGTNIIVMCIYRRFGGARPACPTPVTRRSASFRLRFRFVCAVVGRYPYRWASRVLGSMCVCVLRPGLLAINFCAQARGFEEISNYGDVAFVHRRVGFKIFVYAAMLLLCICVYVLRGFALLRCNFCAQARGL